MDIIKLMEQMEEGDKDTVWPRYSEQDPCYHAKSKPSYPVKEEAPESYTDREEGLVFNQRIIIER